MNTNNKTILVTGATGQQGGAAARHLHAQGWQVRALSRDLSTPAARLLAESGIEVVQGDLSDRSSLDSVLDGVYGVFSVQAYLPQDPTREVIMGKTLADASKAAGVAHFVYSSAAGADSHTGVVEQESKWEIEQYIYMLGLSATILRPTSLMEIYSNIPPLRQAIVSGTLMYGMPAETKMQYIATDNIGAFAAIAFERPQEFIGKALELAGDDLSMAQTTEVFSRVIGRPVRYVEMPIEQVRSFDPNLAALSEWVINVGFRTNIPALRAMYPALMTLETWARTLKWE